MKALLSIALLLAFGACVWGNTPEQIAILEAAAEKGIAMTQILLGYAYSQGDGVPQDDKEAFKWYRKAAEQGNTDAQSSLGGAYRLGEGVIEDKVQAYARYNIAAANGGEGAKIVKEVKALLAKLMTKEQISEAQDLSQKMVKANPKLMGD